MKNLVFIAPPAAGKGTVSSLLEKEYGYAHISTGDLLREKAGEDTEFGHKIKALINEGIFASDEDITRLLREKLAELKDKPFILDGYPRNLNQAEILDGILKEANKEIMVISLEIGEATSMKRALGRVSCPKCKAGYNIYTELKPKVEGICDVCGTALTHRADDTEETYKARLATYYKQTNPLLEYYKEKGILQTVNAECTANELFERVVSKIDVKNKESKIIEEA